MDSFDEVFSAAKAYCAERLSDATYDVFIKGLEPVDFDGSKVTISAHSDFIANIANVRFASLLKEAFQSVLGFPVELEFTVPPKDGTGVPAVPEKAETGSYAFTFDNFIVGSSNKFAHAAAMAVAANPSGAYNPLFIWGDSGLGKTHLLNAIRVEIEKNHPEYKINYIDGEAFANEIIGAIQRGTTDELHRKYRSSDVLLVDDVQFIGGKPSTQEEFFHTFNTLYNAGKQIVLASDRPPKEIKSLQDRILTRMEWGLIADIQPPDFETRVAIIRRKADLLGMDIPDDVAEFIANHLKNNIRQLEGAVKKLNAYRLLENVQPVIGAAQNAIRDILSENQPVPVTIDKIVNEVARTYNVLPQDIRSRKRSGKISDARKTAMYVVHEVTGLTRQEIGEEFGGRDHSTVVYSLAEVEKKMENDPSFRETVRDIVKNIKA